MCVWRGVYKKVCACSVSDVCASEVRNCVACNTMGDVVLSVFHLVSAVCEDFGKCGVGRGKLTLSDVS